MAILATLVALLLAGLFAFTFGVPLTALMGVLGWGLPFWLVPGVLGLLGFAVLSTIGSGLLTVLAISGGGLATFRPLRRLKGWLAFVFRLSLGLMALSLWFALFTTIFPKSGLVFSWDFVLSMVTQPWELWPPSVKASSIAAHKDANLGWAFFAVSIRLGFLFAFFSLVHGVTTKSRRPLAIVTRPFRELWRAVKAGLGGSSHFIGLFDEWLMPWKPGMILLGRSSYEPACRLGRRDDRHLITIATTRSGKGRSSIIPNLLLWPGSALVIDPKGENAAVTARIRKLKLKQVVHILDPFAALEQLSIPPYWWQDLSNDFRQQYQPARYNPLRDLDLDAGDVVEQIRNLGAAMVMLTPGANNFWDNASRMILAGIVAHVVSSPDMADADRHLGTVRDFITNTNGRDMKALGTRLPGDRLPLRSLAVIAAAELKKASETAGSDIMLTLSVHTEWLDSSAIRDHLTASDFSLRDLKQKNTSIYLVMPAQYLDTHSRFLRIFITLALHEAGRGAKPEHSMLFLLDEFAALGELKTVKTNYALLGGNGIKFWPIIQNLTQLRVYGDDWETFLSNSSQHQVFAVNDRETANYYSERLGQHMAWQRSGREWMPHGITMLRTNVELARETGRDSGQSLISFEGGQAAIVTRANYDSLFAFGEYDPNPYELPKLKPWRQMWQHVRRDAAGREDYSALPVTLAVAIWDKKFRAELHDTMTPRPRRARTVVQPEVEQQDRALREAEEILARTAGERATATAAEPKAKAAPDATAAPDAEAAPVTEETPAVPPSPASSEGLRDDLVAKFDAEIERYNRLKDGMTADQRAEAESAHNAFALALARFEALRQDSPPVPDQAAAPEPEPDLEASIPRGPLPRKRKRKPPTSAPPLKRKPVKKDEAAE